VHFGRAREGLFKTWLADHRHDELVKLLEQSSETAISVKVMLAEDRKVLLALFDSLDQRMAAVSADVKGLSGLAFAVRPTARLSRYAERLLCQLARSGGSQFLEVGVLSGAVSLAPMDSDQGHEITPDDPRFFEDDLEVLRTLGLIRFSSNLEGSRIIHLTRPGAAHAERVSQDGWQTPCPL
jgi:hypothetical protein